MAEYSGSIELISGITQKGGGDFPLAAAKDIQVDAEGKRLDEKLSEMDGATQKVEDEISGLVTSVPADFSAMELDPDMSRALTLGIFAIPTVGSTIKRLAVRVMGAGTVRFALVSRKDSEDGTEGVLTIEHILGDVVADETADTATLTLDEGYKVESEGLQFLITADTSIIGCCTLKGMALNKMPLPLDIGALDLPVGSQIAYNIGKLSPAFQPVIEVLADTITPATVQAFAENITERVSEIERSGVGGGETELPTVTEEDDGKVLSVVDGKWAAAVASSGVTSWNDLTDRPFYEGAPTEVEILAPQTTTFTFMSDMDAHVVMPELTAEQANALISDNLRELVVVWGENTYRCQPNFTLGIPAFGNIDLMMGTGDTGEPFIIAPDGLGLIIGDVETAPPEDTTVESTVERTLGLTLILENIQTLDPKFIREVEWDKITDAPFGTIPNMTVLFEGTPNIYDNDTDGETVTYIYTATPAVSVIPPAGTMIGMDYNGESGFSTVTINAADEAIADFTIGEQTFQIVFYSDMIGIITPLSEAPAVKIYLESDVVIPLPEQYLPEIPGTLPAVTTEDNDKVMQVVDGVWTPVTVDNSAIKTYIDDYINEALGGDY